MSDQSTAYHQSINNLSPCIKGFTEVVIVVDDLEKYAPIFKSTFGWEEKNKWNGIDLLYSKKCNTLLLGNPRNEHGFIRLKEYADDVTFCARKMGETWDTGGIFDYDIRVRDINLMYNSLLSHGWSAYESPQEFSFGKFKVKEVLMKGWYGDVVAMIERMAPPLEGFPHMKKSSYVFNSTQIVKHMDNALMFYKDILGFKEYMHHNGASPRAGPNVLGLPHDEADKIIRDIYILHPEGSNDGSIELISFHGKPGKDLSEDCLLRGLGNQSVRMPVVDMSFWKEKCNSNNVKIINQAEEVEVAGIGRINWLAIASPEGAIIEFYEKL